MMVTSTFEQNVGIIDDAPFVCNINDGVNLGLTDINYCCNVMSYNLHGFNQGKTLLVDVLNSGSFDFIFVQEHWLSKYNLHVLNDLNPGYSCVATSAMDDHLSKTILRGRPFGGVAVLFKQKFLTAVKTLYCSERVVCISCGDLVVWASHL